MVILIDGYNLLKQLDPGLYVTEDTRNHLIRLLGAYHKKRGHAIVLIFDGGLVSWPTQELKYGITIVYAGKGKSADDYIKDYISEHVRQDLLLVSSDRELALWANKYEIASIDALPFNGLVRDALYTNEKLNPACNETVKTTTTDDPYLDALMADAAVDVHKKESDRAESFPNRVRRVRESKIDRLLRKKIEKL